MLQMLAKMVCAKELLGLVAFAKFMYTVEMRTTCFPIRSWLVGKLCATVTASIECRERGGRRRRLGLGRTVVGGWYISGRVECIIETAVEGGTRPGVFPEVKRILVTLGLILILEPIGAEVARVLLFRFVNPEGQSNDQRPRVNFRGLCDGLPQFFQCVELFRLLGTTSTDEG